MRTYCINVNGNLYNVTVLSVDGNSARVDVDGWEYEVGIGEDGSIQIPKTVQPAAPESRKKRSSALELAALSKSSGPTLSGKGVVVAHLPGLILEVLVKVGDSVKAGDVVCKMEAMKMVNEILATIDGTIKEILVKEKQNVLENQPLMIIE